MLAVKTIDSLLRTGNKCERRDRTNGRGYGTLVLRIVGKMKGEWYLRWTVKGRTRYHLIGKAETEGKNLKWTRGRYDELSAYVKEGKDPVHEEERLAYEKRLKDLEKSKKGTIRELFEAYVLSLKNNNQPSWEKVDNALLTGKYAAIKVLGEDFKARDVTSEQLRDLLAGISDRGALSMADKTRSYIKTAYNFGMTHDFDYRRPNQELLFGIKFNPAAVIKIDPEARNVGTRYLSPEELRVFWYEPVEYGMHPRFHCALKLIIAIGGVRVQEVVKAEKDEYDPDESLFLVPKTKTKNRMGHTLPVSAIAGELIDEAYAIGVHESPFLFPACKKSIELEKPFHFTSLNTPLTKFCKAVGMKHWTPRDLRRTARTMLEDEALGEEALDIYFNHGRKNSVGRGTYSQSDMLKMKTRVTECWEEKLGRTLWGK